MKKVIKFIGTFGSDLNKVAQAGHFLAGMMVPHFFYMIVNAKAAFISAGLMIVFWVIPKEFYLDVRYENATVADGFEDALSYIMGIFVELMLIYFIKVAP